MADHQPNDLGNYRGKRSPAPRFNNGVPLTAPENREMLGSAPPPNTRARRSIQEIVAGAFRPKWARRPAR